MSIQGIDALIADSSPGDVEIAERALRDARPGCQLRVVADGAEALDFLFCRGRFATRDAIDLPRVLLLELTVPKVSCLQVLKSVRADPVTRQIPVVVLAAAASADELEACYEAGANSCIIKPTDAEDLRQAFRQLALYWLLVNRS